MRYDFETEISRQHTGSAKWGIIQDEHDPLAHHPTDEFFGPDRILPMWVADMDFRTAQPVIDALAARAQHGIFGYTFPGDSFRQAIVGWMQRRHAWRIEPEWIVPTPGVVPALNFLIRTFVAPGEKVLVQTPVYYPFFAAIENNEAQIVRNPLIFEDGRYRMDFADLEQKASDPAVKLAILCHPHNPIGRVWTPDELTRFADICLANDVQIVSDEIHGDLIFSGVKFHPLASLRDDLAGRVITCTAASKTFNLAGLHLSGIIVPDEEQRTRFSKTLTAAGLIAGVGIFDAVAVEAAYNQGEEWLEQVMAYIEGNLRYMQEYLAQHLPQIKVVPPEGTYLIWLDCRALELDKADLRRLMLREARVYLDEGYIFGEEGEGFERINIACPRSILAEALERIKKAVMSRES
jgi:cystathionine beta-lyase